MKTTTFLLISIFILTFQIKSQPVWNPLNTGTCCPLNSIDFVDANTGYVTGKDTILKTTNSGLSWYKQITGTNNVHLYDISFYNSSTGYATGTNGMVIKTVNGGVNWFSQTNGLDNNNFYSLFLINASELYIGGDFGKIFKSVNGGNSWTLLNTGTTESILSIYFVTGNKGYATATGGTVLKTNNGGNSWTSQGIGNYELNDVSFASASVGYIVGGVSGPSVYSVILKTNNGGDTWNIVNYSDPGYVLNKIHLFNSQIGYAVGTNGKILRTVDGGDNWVHMASGTDSLLYNVCFTSNEVGYVSGRNGIILKTTNGLTFVGNTNNSTPHDFHLSQNYPNPFNPTTDINFDIPGSSFVKITVYDLAGNEVIKLVSDNYNAGSYNVRWNALYQPSGVYFYKLMAYDTESSSDQVSIDTKKMVLLK